MSHLELEPVAYRRDIDGLRAVAVLSVILFHLDCLPYGYLGVDVFFVISGFLITRNIHQESRSGNFSILRFYERRIRRILPLALFVVFVSLLAGLSLMLPDDLENLGQSAVATNLFANNILQAITTRNYWDVVNEYKPLMHTWSLGVEEQFYLFWPLIFLIFGNARSRALLAAVVMAIVASAAIYAVPFQDYFKFYYLPFRVFELAAGGAVALVLAERRQGVSWASLSVIPLLVLLVFDHGLPATATMFLVVIFSCGVVAANRPDRSLHAILLENKVSLYLGAISFSLYMWHQPVFAFARYAYFEILSLPISMGLLLLVLVLSMLSYRFIEQPFRRRDRISFKQMMIPVLGLFVFTTSLGVSLHLRGGVIKNIPELEVSTELATRGMHARYNSRIRDYNKDFMSDKFYVLVIGNSFARDWANVLLESEYAKSIEISYIEDDSDLTLLLSRVESADVVFWSEADQSNIDRIGGFSNNVYVVGTKNFGKSSDIFYNYHGNDYYEQRVVPDRTFKDSNDMTRAVFGERYIDLMTPIMDVGGSVPVFTPSKKFISQDCRHLTRAGAEFYAKALGYRIGGIFGRIEKRSIKSFARHSREGENGRPESLVTETPTKNQH